MEIRFPSNGAGPSLLPRGTERILLVDDEKEVGLPGPGGAIVKEDQDYGAVLTSLKALGPDIVYYGGLYPQPG
jgi:hypothetical protein